MVCQVTGHAKVPVRCLQWAAGRLYGAGLHGKLFHVDLRTLRFSNACDSYGGAVWSLAAHPGGKVLAAGCGDGQVRGSSAWRTARSSSSARRRR